MSRSSKRSPSPRASPVTGPTTMPARPTSPLASSSWLGCSDGVPPARLVQMRKTASTAATESATTRRTGLRRFATPRVYRRPAALIGGRRRAAVRDAVAVVAAETPGRVLGERVAVALPVRGAQERGHDLEIPLGDAAGLAPEVGEPEVDVQLEQLDSGRSLGHGLKVATGSDGSVGWPACP